MKKIKLFDYQQKMLEDIINVLTTAATSTFIILPPEYKYIYRWNEHSVEVKGNDGYCRTIEL